MTAAPRLPGSRPGRAGSSIENGLERLVDTSPTQKSQDWRARIAVHPAADLFEILSDAELDELGQDIKRNGLRERLVFWCHKDPPNALTAGVKAMQFAMDIDRKKEAGQLELLDGRNRLSAMERVGLLTEKRLIEECKRAIVIHPYRYSPEEFVISANIRRRHLSAEERRNLIARLLVAHPEKSDRQIARSTGISHPTVAKIRAKGETAGDVEKISTRTDTKGRQQPARKLAPHAREITRDQLAVIRDEAPKESEPAPTIDQLADRKDALRVLDEASRILAQRRAEVLALPIKTRIGRAMSVLDALGIGIDQLVPAGRR